MTNEEAKIIMLNEQPHCGEKLTFPEEKRYEAYDLAIQALEQITEIKSIIDCEFYIQEDVFKYKAICNLLEEKHY